MEIYEETAPIFESYLRDSTFKVRPKQKKQDDQPTYEAILRSHAKLLEEELVIK